MTFERPVVRGEAMPEDKEKHRSFAVRADDAGLWLDGALTIPHDDVEAVWLWLGDRNEVRVRSKRGRGLRLMFTDLADARALVEALGRSPEGTLIETDVEPSLLTAGFDRLPLWKGALYTVLALVVLLISLPFAMRGAGPRRTFARLERSLKVGQDGVFVSGGLGEAFVPYGDIASVSMRESALVMALRDGRSMAFPLRAPARLGELETQIRLRIEGAQAITDDETATKLREAGSVTQLRELGVEDAAYRETHIPRERLWDLFEDPHTDADVRARAVIALSRGLPSDERKRIRIAADCTASPTVRIALENLDEPEEKMATQLDAKLRAKVRPGS